MTAGPGASRSPLAQTGARTSESRGTTDRSDAGDSDGIERQRCHAVGVLGRTSSRMADVRRAERRASTSGAPAAWRVAAGSSPPHECCTDICPRGPLLPSIRSGCGSTRSRRPGLRRCDERSASFPYRPLVSVVTPVYNTDPRWLRACIESVKSQAYPNWQLCLADDGSTRAETRALLREYEGDPRIKIKMLADQRRHRRRVERSADACGRGIRRVSRSRRRAHTGRPVRGSRTSEPAPGRGLHLLGRGQARARRHTERASYFKPDWSPEHFLTNMYTCHLMVVRRALVERIGGFRHGYEGAQDYDLVLRLIDHDVAHSPRAEGALSVAEDSRVRLPDTKARSHWAHDAGRLALEDYVRRNKLDAEILPGALKYVYRVRYRIEGEPLISIVLPAVPDADARQRWSQRVRANAGHAREAHDLSAARSRPARGERSCGRSYAADSAEPDGSRGADGRAPTRGRLRQQKRAAAHARGDHLLFLDWGLKPIDSEWLTALLEFSQQAAIGAVGAKLHYPDGSLKHIGIRLRREWSRRAGTSSTSAIVVGVLGHGDCGPQLFGRQRRVPDDAT